MTKFNEGDKVRITGGYIVEGGMLEVGHEDTIKRAEPESHEHEETGATVDAYQLLESGYYVLAEELELIQ